MPCEKEVQRLQRESVKQAGNKGTSKGKGAQRTFHDACGSYSKSKGVKVGLYPSKPRPSCSTWAAIQWKIFAPSRTAPAQIFSVGEHCLHWCLYPGRIGEEPNIQLLQLYREVKQKGYNGGRTSAFVHLHHYINRTPHITCLSLTGTHT